MSVCQQVKPLRLFKIWFFLVLLSWTGEVSWSQEPLIVGLWGGQSATREVAVQQAIDQAIGSDLREIGFSEIKTESTLDFNRRYTQLGEGKFALLEVDPATYFQAERHWKRVDPQRWQYELLFQSWKSNLQTHPRRANLVTLQTSGIDSLLELRGKMVGILSPFSLASGGVQEARLLGQGMQAGRDFSVMTAPSQENLCKALFTGLVDAAALPEGVVEDFLAKHRSATWQPAQVSVLYVSDLLPGPVWCVHRRLFRRHPDLKARLQCGLPTGLPEEFLMLAKDDYYLTTRQWIAEAE